MKLILWIVKLALSCFVILALIAPFTFLPPQQWGKPVEAIKEEVKVKAPQIKPLHQVKLPNFAAIKNVKEKKKQFFNYIKPAIEQENNAILNLRTQLLAFQVKVSLNEELTTNELQQLNKTAKKYRVSVRLTNEAKLKQLLTKVDIVPAPLVMVQAANESAWGTSRFAREGLNFFGIWCYQAGCGMVPRAREQGAVHEVEAFKTVDAAVKRYLYNINTNKAYQLFRTIREQLREQSEPLLPEALATGLVPYSSRGAHYVTELIDMLRHNQQYLR